MLLNYGQDQCCREKIFYKFAIPKAFFSATSNLLIHMYGTIFYNYFPLSQAVSCFTLTIPLRLDP